MTTQYELFIEAPVHAERKSLPGHIRQLIKRTIEELGQEPRPYNSRRLEATDFRIPEYLEIRRIRIDKWRLIYAINEGEGWVWIWVFANGHLMITKIWMNLLHYSNTTLS